MRNKFRKGNRVRVYATLNGKVAETKGVVTGIRQDGVLRVDLEIQTTHSIFAHPKQVRKLVRKG